MVCYKHKCSWLKNMHFKLFQFVLCNKCQCIRFYNLRSDCWEHNVLVIGWQRFAYKKKSPIAGWIHSHDAVCVFAPNHIMDSASIVSHVDGADTFIIYFCTMKIDDAAIVIAHNKTHSFFNVFNCNTLSNTYRFDSDTIFATINRKYISHCLAHNVDNLFYSYRIQHLQINKYFFFKMQSNRIVSYSIHFAFTNRLHENAMHFEKCSITTRIARYNIYDDFMREHFFMCACSGKIAHIKPDDFGSPHTHSAHMPHTHTHNKQTAILFY